MLTQRIFQTRHFSYWMLLPMIVLLWQLSFGPGNGITGIVSPILVSPYQGEITTVQNYPPLAIPTFRWIEVPEATQYQLQVNTDPYFNLPNVIEILTPNQQFTPTGAGEFPDGVYYWRVRVAEPLPGSLFSEPFQYVKSWAAIDNAPQLIAPANGALMASFTDPAFAWEQVSGAAQYRFQIARTMEGFLNPIYQVDTSALEHQPGSKFTNGIYDWRILPLDPAGHTGTPSVVYTFTLAFGSNLLDQTPQLVSPADEATLPFTPTFTWTAITGAEKYRLEYTSGPMCDFSAATAVQTRQTSYTPPFLFSNQVLYCWRVRAESGDSIGDWSETHNFSRNWNLVSQSLTPTPGYPYARSALFSWTPVAGAAYYTIEVAGTSAISEALYQADTINTAWVSPDELLPAEYSWQVTAYDTDGKIGLSSIASVFQNPLTATVPSLVYPGYYYDPEDPSYAGSPPLNPAQNNTAAFPLFIWQRVLNPAPYGGLLAHSYRIQVSQTPSFSSIAWEYDTQNTAASPTLEAPFAPQTDQNYYWRVCPIQLTQPVCQLNPANGDEWWSQTWIARFDPDLSIAAGNNEVPQLLHPRHGHEQVEGTPVLEWQPVASAAYYQVQVSRDPDFNPVQHEADTVIPLYISPVSFAQRNLGLTDFGTFYWRVRSSLDGEYSPWSETRRFQIASQSEWRRVRTLGNERNKLLVGSDPGNDADANFDLSTLYVSQSDSAWYLGFNANIEPAVDMTYVIYIDTDHLDGSGGSASPMRPYSVSTIAAHRPEYVLYIDQVAGTLTAQNTFIYTWTSSGWGFGQALSAVGGAMVFTPGTPGYLELELPDSAIGASNAPNSISVIVFSTDASGIAQDSVPADPAVPGEAVLSRFSSVSDRMNLLYPVNTLDNPGNTIPTLVPFFWDWPTGSDPSASDPAPATPFAGAQLQVALDPQFTILVADQTSETNSYYVGTPVATVSSDLVGDATYYWRVRPRYLNAGVFFGAWSETYSYTRAGFTADNLRVSTQLTTPEFRWDRVEGASLYQLQVSTQSDFNTLNLNIATPNPAFTSLDALTPGTYFWRVGMLRNGLSSPTWAAFEQVSLSLPVPVGLTPDNPTLPFQSIPTLCWQPVLLYSTEFPVASAWKYQLQVSKTSDFQTILETAVTEMHCWTPQSWYPQGIYYWRVAMIDGSGNTGAFSAPAIVVMQFTLPDLLSPGAGLIFQTPDFSWSAVPGSAYYRVDVSQSADFYPLFDTVLSVNTHYTPTLTYPPGCMYYWRVAAFTPNGYQAAFVSGQITIGSPSVWLPMIKK